MTVHDDQFVRRIILRPHAADGLGQKAFAIVHHENDADKRPFDFQFHWERNFLMAAAMCGGSLPASKMKVGTDCTSRLNARKTESPPPGVCKMELGASA